MPQLKPHEQRTSIRFNKVFEVAVSTEEFGEVSAIARNISAGGMQIETSVLLPLGSEVRVTFHMPDSDGSIVARAEVKNHYCFNYSEDGALRWARGMGVRFVEFLSEATPSFQSSPSRMRTLH